jgi:glycine/D-amino acid oxidase-like deaminating enzyme
MTALGLALQKRKGLQTLSDPERQLRQLGSVMVAPALDAAGVQREYELLKSMGCNVEALSSDEVVAVAGKSSGFVCGLKFPDDAIIDSATYSECLLAAAAAVPGVTVSPGCQDAVLESSSCPITCSGRAMRAMHPLDPHLLISHCSFFRGRSGTIATRSSESTTAISRHQPQ